MSYKLNQKCVDEVGHNFVVVGGFEDRADHLNKKDYFRLYLQGSLAPISRSTKSRWICTSILSRSLRSVIPGI